MPKYYPKSQIKTNLYTNGGEYILSTTKKDYTGDYYEVSDGAKYTGKFPGDRRNILLSLPLNTEPLSIKPITVPLISLALNPSDPGENEKNLNEVNTTFYSQLNKNFKVRALPTSNFPLPTKKEYEKGEFYRYFCKKTNELIYMEIDKKTYKKLLTRDPIIAFDLYMPYSLPWSLTGGREQTYRTNKNIVNLVEDKAKWYGFTLYFKKDFLRYYVSKSKENLYTNGGEYKLPNSTNYIGFYHLMSDGEAMTGKKHGEGSDMVLTPISPTTPTGGGGGGY